MEWSIPMTNKTLRYLFVTSMVAMLPVLANAAGTYYVGNYQSPQQNYSELGYAAQRYNGPYRAGQNGNYSQDTTYTRTRMRVTPNDNAYVGRQYSEYTKTETKTDDRMESAPKSDKGFWIAPSLSHEFANWRFDMKNAGSILHYDDVRWNVLDVTAGYRFDAGNLPLQIDAGFKYGMQFGDSTMEDDDISHGGYLVTEWVDENDAFIGYQVGHALSVGTSNGGDMFGFNIGLGLTDFFKMGAVRVTPSVGYRHMKYKLETKNTYGLTVDTGYCSTVNGSDEVQCDPIVVLQYGDQQKVLWDEDVNEYGFFVINPGATGVSTGGTYEYELPGTSHSYETEWAGPYLALDMNYDINANNAVNARIEFGLPIYDSVGDQPYRPDWAHTKSVEDKGGFGDAWHFGLGANYMTAITNTLSFTMGVTFDYYSVNGADASTYLNRDYYESAYNTLLDYYEDLGRDEAYMLANDPTAQNIVETEQDCPGWVCKADGEIESVYKSLGLRVGLNAKF